MYGKPNKIEGGDISVPETFSILVSHWWLNVCTKGTDARTMVGPLGNSGAADICSSLGVRLMHEVAILLILYLSSLVD